MATDATEQLDDESSPGSRNYFAANAEWKNIQKNTFCRWANEHLRASGLQIDDLATDLGDGILLIRLAESLAGVKMTQRYNSKPTNRTQKLENVTMCLHFLEQEQKVRIVNIDSGDIVDGNLKLILGLMHALIVHYSISMTSPSTPHPAAAAAVDTDAAPPQRTKSKLSPKQQLLAWINHHLTGRRVTNFTSDWKDGKTLADLVSSLAPGQCNDWRSWDEENFVSNTKQAMDAATAALNIAPLLTPEEMCDARIDELSMMTYLSQFPNAKLNQDVANAVASVPEQSADDEETGKDEEDEARRAALVQAYGDGLSAGYVGHPAKFTVTSADRTRPLSIDVNVDGPSQVRMGRRETDEGIEFTYVAVVEGEYFLSVIYADRLHIPGSPFRTKFTPIKNTYKVTVYTGKVFGAGTDANVHIIFVGEIGETGQIQLKSSKTHHFNKFEKGNRDEFFVEVDNIGELKHIRMGHDNAGGPGAAWFLERVEIELPLLHRSWNFPHSRWISKDEDDKTLEHVLYPDSADCALP